MKERSRILFLIAIMTIAILIVGATSTTLLYGAALDEQRARLVEAAQSQARLMEAIANFDTIYIDEFPGGVKESVLSQVRDAHENYEGFGETGEFTLAERESDLIVFLLRHRHFDLDQPEPVPFQSDLAEPMRRALSGESGTVIGFDYRGETVLAAYEPVAVLDMGIVAKIDLTEIRAPFIRAGLIAGVVMTTVILLGMLLFKQVSDPMLKQLAVNEERFRELFNNMSSGVAIYQAEGDGKNFIVKDINKAGEKISQVKRDEIVGMHVDEVFTGIYEMGLFDIFQEVWQTGELIHLRAARYEDFRTVYWVDNHVYRLPSGELVAVYEDITEKVEAESALRLQSAIAANMSESVNLVRAEDGIIVYTNPKMEETFGYSQDELIYEHVTILNASTTTKTANDTANEIMNAISENSVWEGEVQNKKKDGTIFWTNASVTLFDHPEHGTVLVSVQMDITERKRAEAEREHLLAELEARNEEMESFIYTISHDMKSPLITLDGFSAALQNEPNLSEQGQHYLKRIRANVSRMGELTIKLLDLSRIGRVIGDVVSIDMGEMLAEIHEHMELDLKGVKFEILEPLVNPHGDRLRIHQVFTNLIDNAVKFRSPEKKLLLQISCDVREAMILFQVSLPYK